MPYLQTLSDGTLLLKLFVQPRASKNQLAGLHNDMLKIRLTAPPVEGQANKAVIAFLSKKLHLPKSAITIKRGQQNREKQVVIADCDEKDIRQILSA